MGPSISTSRVIALAMLASANVFAPRDNSFTDSSISNTNSTNLLINETVYPKGSAPNSPSSLSSVHKIELRNIGPETGGLENVQVAVKIIEAALKHDPDFKVQDLISSLTKEKTIDMATLKELVALAMKGELTSAIIKDAHNLGAFVKIGEITDPAYLQQGLIEKIEGSLYLERMYDYDSLLNAVEFALEKKFITEDQLPADYLYSRSENDLLRRVTILKANYDLLQELAVEGYIDENQFSDLLQNIQLPFSNPSDRSQLNPEERAADASLALGFLFLAQMAVADGYLDVETGRNFLNLSEEDQRYIINGLAHVRGQDIQIREALKDASISEAERDSFMYSNLSPEEERNFLEKIGRYDLDSILFPKDADELGSTN